MSTKRTIMELVQLTKEYQKIVTDHLIELRALIEETSLTRSRKAIIVERIHWYCDCYIRDISLSFQHYHQEMPFIKILYVSSRHGSAVCLLCSMASLSAGVFHHFLFASLQAFPGNFAKAHKEAARGLYKDDGTFGKYTPKGHHWLRLEYCYYDAMFRLHACAGKKTDAYDSLHSCIVKANESFQGRRSKKLEVFQHRTNGVELSHWHGGVLRKIISQLESWHQEFEPSEKKDRRPVPKVSDCCELFRSLFEQEAGAGRPVEIIVFRVSLPTTEDS